MRIALNALQVRAKKSGVGQYISGLIDGLLGAMSPDDHLIVYATPFNAPNYQRDDPRLETRRWGPAAKRPIRLAYEWAFLPRWIERDRIDVFHGPANFLPRRCACPSVVTVHDLSQWVHPSRFGYVRRAYWHWMTLHTIRLATHIIAVSENTRSDLGRYLSVEAERIEVIPEAAAPSFRPLPDCRYDSPPLRRYGIGGPYVLHVGTLEPGKNIPRLLEAFARFRRESALDWRLVLAGDRGWLRRDIFHTIRRHALEDRVILAGYVPDEDLPLLYNAAEFFAFPSLNEGFGLPPLEAMACGAPVIASNVSSLPEVLAEAPLYVDPLDVGALAAAMLRLARDPVVRRERSEAGLKQAKRYSWMETGRRTLEVYRRVAGNRAD